MLNSIQSPTEPLTKFNSTNFRFRIMRLLSRSQSYIRWRWKITKITFMSMFYNDHISTDYIFDTLMQPAFWFVDQFTAVLGPIFVFLVIFLTVRTQKLVKTDFLILNQILVICGIHSLLDWSPILSPVQGQAPKLLELCSKFVIGHLTLILVLHWLILTTHSTL